MPKLVIDRTGTKSCADRRGVARSLAVISRSAGRLAKRMDGQQPAGRSVPFDTSVPHIARVYIHWLGRKDNYEADHGRRTRRRHVPRFAGSVRAVGFSVGRCLVAEAGIQEFLDIDTGLPTKSPRELRRSLGCLRGQRSDRAGSRQGLLASSLQGAAAYIDADLRDAGKILAEAAGVLGFSQPVEVMLLGVVHGIPDENYPAAILVRLISTVPSGSYLVMIHPAQWRHRAVVRPWATTSSRPHRPPSAATPRSAVFHRPVTG